MNRRTRKKNNQMFVALSIGAVLNLVILVIMGGITVYKYVAPKEVALQAPPPLQPIEPTVVKYNQQKTKDRQQNSQRPRQKTIKTRAINSISTPNIDIQMSDVSPGVGISTTLGDSVGGIQGLSSGSLRMGVSAVDFFGIKSKGERIVIIVDVAASMLEVQRGDIAGFARVKAQVQDVIDDLNSATLFNLMVFSNGLDVMSNRLVLANAENKQRASEFIQPYWDAQGSRFTSDARRGVYLKNYEPQYTEFKPIRGNSRTDMALLAAFEQRADAIFMITDGTPDLVRTRNRTEQKAYEKRLAEWEKAYAKASDEEKEEHKRAVEKWREDRARGGTVEEVAARNAKGMDAQVRERYYRHPTPPWGIHKPTVHVVAKGDDFFVDWMKDRATEIYGRGRNNLPSLNLIGYSIPRRGDTANFLNDLRRAFPGGQFKVFGEYVEEAS
ncbi:MAG: hypothetical protein ACPGN3_15035 [Opitutales bacterium]